MIDQIPPVYVQEQTADDFQPMRFFATQKDAKDFVNEKGGFIIKDTLKEQYIVIRIPKDKVQQ